MWLVYSSTWMVDFDGFHIGKYTMDGCWEWMSSSVSLSFSGVINITNLKQYTFGIKFDPPPPQKKGLPVQWPQIFPQPFPRHLPNLPGWRFRHIMRRIHTPQQTSKRISDQNGRVVKVGCPFLSRPKGSSFGKGDLAVQVDYFFSKVVLHKEYHCFSMF